MYFNVYWGAKLGRSLFMEACLTGNLLVKLLCTIDILFHTITCYYGSFNNKELSRIRSPSLQDRGTKKISFYMCFDSNLSIVKRFDSEINELNKRYVWLWNQLIRPRIRQGSLPVVNCTKENFSFHNTVNLLWRFSEYLIVCFKKITYWSLSDLRFPSN